jgi:20S proteasome alpha/beta subunit
MTLVIAASGRNFMVVGADSRATIHDASGNRIEINTVKKIIPVAKHVVVLIYGEADESIYLAKRFKFLNKKIDGVSRVAEKYAEFCRKEMQKIANVPRLPEYFPMFGFIVAGLDPARNGRVYNVPRSYTLKSHNGFLLGRPDPVAHGGKPFIALYQYNQKYDEEMNKDQLTQYVAQCIYDTMSVDGDVGGRIRITVIDSEGMFDRPYQNIRKGIEQWGQPLI